MAGLLDVITTSQKPRVNEYTRELLSRAEEKHGLDSHAYRGVYNQYFRIPTGTAGVAHNTRHFDALGDLPTGVERLYRRVLVIELHYACASECVFCIRGLYETHMLKSAEISEIVDYLALDQYLTEVLLTGGDPLLAPRKLSELVSAIAERAPNIQIVRLGTRFPVQNPLAFDAQTYDIFRMHSDRFLFEIAIQVNHPFELQSEAVDVFRHLAASGTRLYSQNVLLRGVNDDIGILLELYDRLRALRVIPHYFFHAVPMVSTDDLRTSVARGLALSRELTTCGYLSGMAKPTFALMTDIGKVTPYEGSILSKDEDGYLKIRTSYRLEDRLHWSPGYQLPDTATVNEWGTLDVSYLDGTD